MTRHLTIDDVVHQPLPGMDGPTKVRFTVDGEAVTYLQGAPGSMVRSLWRHELANGERVLIAAAAADDATRSIGEELRRERTRERGSGVTDYQVADDGTLLTVVAGRLLVSRDGRPAKPVAGADAVQDARLAPDGRRIAFVRGGDVHVIDTADGSGPLPLSSDAEPGVFNGLPEYIAAEELGRQIGMWWSTDSRQLAFAHVDEREVPPYAIPHLGGDRVALEEQRYPLAGGANARVSLRVASVGGSRAAANPDGGHGALELDLGMAPDDYLARVVADPAGGWLVAVLPRAQRSLRWLRADGAGRVQQLWVEESTPWLNLDDDTRVLADGRILRSTERSGFRHLELRAADGTFERQLTQGAWVVIRVVEVDQAARLVYAIATRDGILERHLYTVSLDGGEPKRLTTEPGWHDATVSGDGRRWADTWSSLRSAPAVAVHSRGHDASISIHRPTATAASLDLPAPELLEVCAADGETTLHAALYRPGEPVGDKPPPAVVWVYGGPHSQKVADEWGVTVEMHRQMLRQLGFAVLVVDNRGTFNRGLSFEAPLWRELGAIEVADQAAAVRQLAERGAIDPSRVGITGGSYGGYMTLLAMLREPDLFRVGVAAAPVTDWHLYDSAYTERYMDAPAANVAGYRCASLLGRAGDLSGALLVIHGLIDENVHFRHTARLLAALADADRDCDLLVFPAERHGERGDAARRQRQRRALGFFERHLG